MDGCSRDDCIALLKEKYSVLGRLPQKSDFTEQETAMIKSFLGPWPRALEKAGIKEVSEKRRETLQKRTEKRIRAKIKKRGFKIMKKEEKKNV